MKKTLTRIGTFLLALLMLMSVPLVAFAAPEVEDQARVVPVDSQLLSEYPGDYDFESYYDDSEYDDPDEYDDEDYDLDYGNYYWDEDYYDYDPDAMEPEELLKYLEAALLESTIEAASLQVIRIRSQAEMVAFLSGGLGPNNAHYILEWSGALPIGNFRGRGLVDGIPFTGIFDGGNNVITNLHLTPRGLIEPGATAALNDIGLFRVLGNGATIRDLTLENAAYSDMVGISDWNTAVGNIGILAGRVMPGSLVTIENITVNGSSASFGGSRALNGKRVGGLVGFVEAGSILNITNINIGTDIAAGFSVTLNATGSDRILPSAGGVVGQAAGNVNILGSQNAVNVVVQNLNTGSGRAIQHAGGVIGRATGSANLVIENLTTRGTIGTQQMAGGFVGSTLAGGTTVIRGSTNHANVTVGGSNTHVGGFIGWARNATTIQDSVNRGNITHTGSGTNSNVNSFGGFIGRAQGVLTMQDVENFAPVQKTGGGRSRGGGIVGWSNNLVNITRATNHGNVGSTAGTAGGDFNSGMGGIVGYIQFAGTAANRNVFLNEVVNHGNIGFNAAGGSAIRTRNGGIVGVSRNRSGTRGLEITNALNTGRIQATQVAGGIVGWSQSDRTTVDSVINRGDVSVPSAGANRCAGGIVGRSARHDLRIIRAGNEGNIAGGTSGSSTNTALSGVGGIVGNINRGTRNRIEQSYNAGSITGGTATVGGIVGQIRRSGSTIIVDTYNIGTVSTRRGASSGRHLGHGILGHRGSAPTVTLERVFNAGNVQGRPIFGRTNSTAVTSRMVYRQVFWDRDVYTGAQPAPHQAAAPGIMPLHTTTLTSGQVAGLRGGHWLVNGWMTDDGHLRYPTEWESYPFLAWQTGTRYTTPGRFEPGVMQTPFFAQVYPGASHIVTANPTTVQFLGVAQNVRTFNPYTARTAAGHPTHAVGNTTMNVARAVNLALSVGLISSNSVVGFGENDLPRPIVSAHDSETGQLINFATIYQNNARIPRQDFGMAFPAHVELTDNLSARALGYVVQPGWTFTQADIDNGHIRILMDRVPITEPIQVHIVNISAVADTPPRIPVARNPLLDRNSTSVARGGTAALPFFDITGAMWGDELFARAVRFEPDTRPLSHDMIVRGAGTTANPWVVYMYLEDICRDPITLEIIRTYDNDTEYGALHRLPHGGRVTTDLANPALSNNFQVEFRSRPGIDENPMALAHTGNTGANLNQWNVRFATSRTEVRVTPNWGQAISGGGANFTYRTTGWHYIGDIEDFDEDGGRIQIVQVPVQYEIPVTTRVVEEFNIPGRAEPWRALIPTAELTLSYDADGTLNPVSDIRTHVIAAGTPAGTFPTRLVASDLLKASAPAFLPNYHEVDEGELEPHPFFPTGTATLPTFWGRDPIYIPLTRTPAGIVHGFVLNALMFDDPDSPHAPINGARVTIFNAAGEVVGMTTTGPDGYYQFIGLPTGQNYTVTATAVGFGSGFGDPTPVYLPYGANAESHVFLRANDTPHGFMIHLYITEMGTTNNLGEHPTVATLTYGTANTRDSIFVSPLRTIRADAQTANWREGSIVVNVNRTGFAEVTIDNLGDYIDDQGENVAHGFIVINVQVPRMVDLTIDNIPDHVEPVYGQTESGTRAATSSVTINAGVATGYYFLGWVLAGAYDPNPAVGDNIDDFPSAILTASHTFTMPLTGAHWIALWGDEDGYIGTPNRHNLVIENLPDFAVRPTGQTPTQALAVGTIVTLDEGTPVSGDWSFLGWIRYDDVLPGIGDNISDFLHALTGVVTVTITPQGHRYTAIWGNEDGYVGIPNDNNLVIDNIPDFAVRPTSQTASQALEVGTVVTLNAGTPVSGDWNFLGWIRYDDALPAIGDNISDFPHALTGVVTVTIAARVHRYTAIWGNEDGYVGIPNDNNLVIDNIPDFAVRPTSQTASQTLEVGTLVTLSEGTPVSGDWNFLGWIRYDDALPAIGDNISDFPHALTGVVTVTIAARVHRYTAIWGNEDGYVGIPNDNNLVIDNIPDFAVRPTSQTASQALEVGTVVTLNAGTPVSGDWNFLGWIRYDDALPAIGDNISDFPHALTGVVTVTIAARVHRYAAIWGNEAGYVGIPNDNNLVINNIPDFAVRPTSQTASQTLEVGTIVTLNEGTPVSGNWNFLGWIRYDDALPAIGDNISNFPHAMTGVVTVTIAARVHRYTAIWGNEAGYVGIPNDNNLVINNIPDFAVRPTSQTASQTLEVGTIVTLSEGTPVSGDWNFLGWIRYDDALPALGDNISAFPHVLTGVVIVTITAQEHKYTAIWGNEAGYVGIPNDNNLVINNIPDFAVRPTSQTASQTLEVGTIVTLNEGTPVSGNWNFLGWIRYDDALPAIGDNISNFPHALTGVVTVTITAQEHKYTAIWGNENGYVGIPNDHNLVINNIPDFPVRPTSQTASQTLEVGTVVTLNEGTPVSGNWNFLGWIRYDDALPAVGENISGFPHALTGVVTVTITAQEHKYTAIWGNENGYVGIPNDHNLVINNIPDFPVRPTSQTASQTLEIGTVVTLNAGTPVSGDWNFLGWIRYDDALPAIGDNISNFPHALTGVVTVTIAARVHRYTAIWGNEAGYVGIPNSHNLVINNLPDFEVRPTSQTASQTVEIGAEVVLNAGTPVGRWDFLGWVRVTEGVTLPQAGDNFADWSAANPTVSLGLTHTAQITAADPMHEYLAIWGNRGIVGALPYRITFHAYGNGAFQVSGEVGLVDVLYLEIPVEFDEPLCPVAMAPVIALMEADGLGLAFWGWFTDEHLDAENRLRRGHRRATVGATGFNINRVFTEALFNSYADADSNINLYAIWSLWGDVNDDDAVNGIDVSLVSQYVRRFPGISIVRPAAHVSRGPAITGVDVSMISQYVRRFPGIVLGQPPSTPPAPRAVVLGAQMSMPDASAPELWNRVAAFELQDMSIPAEVAFRAQSASTVMPLNAVGAHQIWSVSHEVGYRGEYVDVRLRMDQITQHGMCWTMFILDFDTSVLGNPRLSPRIDRAELTTDMQEAYDTLTGALRETVLAPFRGGNATTHNMIFEGVHMHNPASGEVIVSWQSNPNPEVPDNFTSGIFVDIRFDILSDAPIGISPIDISQRTNDVFLAGVGSIPLEIVWESFTNGSVAVLVDIPQVRIVDEDGNLISAAALTAARNNVTPVSGMTITPATGADAGRFAVVGTTVGDVFTASAQNFINNTHTVTAAEAAGLLNGTITYIVIVLAHDDGVRFNLTVNNAPIARPADQTPVTGSLAVGTALTWNAGTPSVGWHFLGWTSTTEGLVVGEQLPEGILITPPTTMPRADLTVWAVWGDSDGYYGQPDSGIITVGVDRDGNPVVTIPPIFEDTDYDYTVGEDGTITIIITPGDDDDVTRDNVAVNLPPHWDYDLTTGGDGNIVVVIAPPSDVINVEVDQDGNPVITIPPIFEDTDYDYTVNDDGTITIVITPGEDDDATEDNIIVDLPTDWDYDMSTEDGNIVVVITPELFLVQFWMNDDTGDNGRGERFAYALVVQGRTVTAPATNPTRESRQLIMEPVVTPTVPDEEDEYCEDDDVVTDEDAVVEDDAVDEDAATDDETIVDDEGDLPEDDAADEAKTEDAAYEAEPSNDEAYLITLGSDDLLEMLNQAVMMQTREETVIYTFAGWYTCQTLAQSTRFNFNTAITGPINLYARWEVVVEGSVTHTVRLYRNDGSQNLHYTAYVPDGELLSDHMQMTDPARVGHTFTGWFEEAQATTRFADFDVIVEDSFDLFAGWAPVLAVTHTVTFQRNDNSGTAHQTAVVESGQRVNLPVAPSRFGFIFRGWHTDAEGTQAFNFDTAITSNLYLYARWEMIVAGGGGGGPIMVPTVVLPDPVVPIAPFSEYHNAFIIGFPDGTIRPQGTLTRAEIVTVLFRLLDDDFRERVWSQSNRFTDVNEGQWFNNAISTMANAGILDRDEEFRPNDAVTRAEFASMVARFFEDVEAVEETQFYDIEDHWAEEYINRIAQFNWVQGVGDGNFNPDAQMTRAEATAIINRMLERIVESTDDLLAGRTRWPDKTNVNAWYYLYMQEATHSTEFERLSNGTVRWIEILTNIDWTVLERAHSTPGSIVAARAVQQAVNG